MIGSRMTTCKSKSTMALSKTCRFWIYQSDLWFKSYCNYNGWVTGKEADYLAHAIRKHYSAKKKRHAATMKDAHAAKRAELKRAFCKEES